MYIVFEALACVALACVLGALLFVVSIVLLTLRERVNLVPPALHRITHQILHMNASLGESGVKAGAANAQIHLGGAPSALVLGEPRN